MAIVAQYDWTVLGIHTVTDSLKHACIGALTERQLPTDIAVEAIIAAKDSKNPRILAFLQYVLTPLSQTSKESNELLRKKFPKRKLPEFGKGVFGGEGGMGRVFDGSNRELPK